MTENKIRIEDHGGNIYYPHTKADVVFMEDNVSVQQKVKTHLDDTVNPHGVTKAQVGLSSVQNYSVASQAEAEAGTTSSRYMTPQRSKQAIDAQVRNDFDSHLAEYGFLGAVLTYTQSSGQSVPANTLTTLNFSPSEEQFMKCLGQQFEVKKPGGYLIQLMFYVANSTPDGTNFLLQLALNTAHAHSIRLKHSPIAGDSWAVYDIIHSIQLRAGDIVEAKFRHNAGSAINSQYSRMKFTWLGNGGL